MMDFMDRQTVFMKEYTDFKSNLIVENNISPLVSALSEFSPAQSFEMC
jgi:hypothetical protein